MISPAINLLLTVILCICLRKAESQTTAIDSLKKVLIAQKEESENRVNTLNELASKLLDSDSIAAALAYATEAKAIANKMNYKTGKAFAYYNLARFNIQKNNLTEALEFSLPALDMYTTLGNIRKTTELHTFSSYIYTKQFNLYQAIKSQYQALKGYEVLKDTPQIAYTIGNLATLHRAQGNNAEALQYHSAALKFYTKLKDRSGIANSYWGIGLIYNAEGKYQPGFENGFCCPGTF